MSAAAPSSRRRCRTADCRFFKSEEHTAHSRHTPTAPRSQYASHAATHAPSLGKPHVTKEATDLAVTRSIAIVLIHHRAGGAAHDCSVISLALQ